MKKLEEKLILRTNSLPIVTAFKGTLTVEGTIRGIENARPFYSRTVTAYGESIGELLDNLVETSVSLANDVFAWVARNEPADYQLKDDYWYISLAHPDILETSKDNPQTHSKDNDTGSGSSLDSIEDVVRFPVLIRDIQTKATATWLLLQKTDKSEIVDEAAIPHKGIHEVTSFNEMTKFGFTGVELDTILEVAEREGRVQKYIHDLNLARSYRKKISASNETSVIKPHQKWWRKLVGSN
jgi:hypothetical protein